MRFGWAGFLGKARLRTIESGMADMRETLAMLVAQTPIANERAQSLAALAERVSAMEQLLSENSAALRKLARAALVGEAQSDSQDEAIVRLNTGLLRIERQIDLDAEEARKVATGLLERIERLRSTAIEWQAPTGRAPD